VKTPALAAALVLLAGCGSSGPAKSGWSGPPKANASGKLPVSEFNDFLAGDGEEFARSPIAAVTEFLGLDRSSASETTVVATSPGEVRDYSEVVVTLDGLLDDSVRAARYTVELHRQAKAWRVSAADWAQRCRPGRGHQDFSSKPCV
jgi:hypothetical protein